MLKRYPFDPTGQSATNLVRNETHTLDTLTDVRKPRIVFTRLGAFFNDSLVVTHNGKKLTLNSDYRYTFFWQEATMKAGGLPVSVAFQIINKRLTGDIQITYQVVGGEFQEKAIQLEELIKLLPFDARNVFWDDVINKPVAYEPVRHLHHINDVFGLSRLLGVLGELRRSLEGQSVLKLKSVYDRFLKLKQYVDANMGDLEKYRDEVRRIIETFDKSTGNIITRDVLNEVVNAKANELQDLTASRVTPLEENKQNIERRLNAHDAEIETLKQQITDTSLSIAGDVRLKIKAIADSVRQSQKATGREISTFKQDVNTCLDGFDNRITDTISEYDSKLTELSDTINTGIIDVNSKLAEQKEELERRIQLMDPSGSMDEYNNQLNTLQASIDDVENTLNTRLTEITREIGVVSTKTNNLERTLSQVESTLTNELARVEQKADNNKTAIDSLTEQVETKESEVTQKIQGLTTGIEELTEKQTELETKFDTEVGAGVKVKLNQLDTLTGDINTRVGVLEEAKTDHEGRIVALEGKPIRQSQLDDEEIKRLVSARLNEIIVDKRNELSDPMLSIPNLIVYPDEEGGVTYGENETNRVYPVQSMDPAITHNELQRSVFTPATVFEFTKTTTWTVPDIYDKLVAQVFVTAGVRGKTLPDGNLLIHPPSTVMRYIKLKGGTNVPITVGSISSFGAFVTNDGSLEQKGLIQPTYPIVMETNNLVNEDENIRQYYGKLGKVVIVV